MSGREASRYRQALESSELVTMAGATVGSLSPPELKAFTDALGAKSDFLISIVRDREALTEDTVRTFFGKFLSMRRHTGTLISDNTESELTAAIKSLRVSRLEPLDAIKRFSRLKGAPSGVLEDVAMESVHFLNPDIFGLATRWVFNPENGRGALSPMIRAAVPPDFNSRQVLLREAKGIIDGAGFNFSNFYGLDVACSIAYAGGIIGAKDTSMNSGGMEALFPNSMVLAAMILGVRREIIAHS